MKDNKHAQSSRIKSVAILGAGPAGLTAAYLLAANGCSVTVFEKDKHYVGGISRTEEYKGFLFDIGGHRFFSKSPEVVSFWKMMLKDDLLTCERKSRIYYHQRFFKYPLEIWDILKNLGLWESTASVFSYVWQSIKPLKKIDNFEDWVIARFGKRLYKVFFKTYTEKVWGIPCNQISADWAAQRIKNLTLRTAIWNAMFPSSNKSSDKKLVKTLVDTFFYPTQGPGMLWKKCAKAAKENGALIEMGATVSGLVFSDTDQHWDVIVNNKQRYSGFDYVISTLPISELIPGVNPTLGDHVIAAAKSLNYRDFILVALILRDRQQFSDNWIYIHDPSVKVGRIQNFKAWSRDMVPDQSLVCLGMEYFVNQGDEIWEKSNEDLAKMAFNELLELKLASNSDLVDWHVIRQCKAYPVYDDNYSAKVDVIRNALANYESLILIGRNGMHKYNNQDHSMMTAMLAVKNIIAGENLYDVWKVNQDAEYIEEGHHEMQETHA